MHRSFLEEHCVIVSKQWNFLLHRFVRDNLVLTALNSAILINKPREIHYRIKKRFTQGRREGVGGEWVKMPTTVVGWWRKIWLYQSPKKQNLNQNTNDSKPRIWNSWFCFFKKILFQFRAYNFSYLSLGFSVHYQSFFYFSKVLKPTETSEKVHSFYDTVLLKKSHFFYEHQLTWH